MIIEYSFSMNIFNKQTGVICENNNLNINCNHNTNLYNNTTPSGPTTQNPIPSFFSTPTPIAAPSLSTTGQQQPPEQQQQQTPISTDSQCKSVSFHKNVTSIGDIRFPELSPNNEQMTQEQLESISGYFYDKYPNHWRSDLTATQNVFAMQHFEQQTNIKYSLLPNGAAEGQSDTLTDFCINNYDLINTANQTTNIDNQTSNTPNQSKEVCTELIKTLFYHNVIDQDPQQLKKSFEYSLSIFPSNHNNSLSHTPPLTTHSNYGLSGGMPRAKSKKKAADVEDDDADEDEDEEEDVEDAPEGIIFVTNIRNHKNQTISIYLQRMSHVKICICEMFFLQNIYFH